MQRIADTQHKYWCLQSQKKVCNLDIIDKIIKNK
jgi:hypothetical protein